MEFFLKKREKLNKKIVDIDRIKVFNTYFKHNNFDNVIEPLNNNVFAQLDKQKQKIKIKISKIQQELSKNLISNLFSQNILKGFSLGDLKKVQQNQDQVKSMHNI